MVSKYCRQDTIVVHFLINSCDLKHMSSEHVGNYFAECINFRRKEYYGILF